MMDKSFKLLQFMNERMLKISPKQVGKVELAIVSGLNWDLHSVTALCFVNHFAKYSQGGFERRRINEIILHTQEEIKFTKYKPSIIAASALLSKSSLLHSNGHPDYRTRVIESRDVAKDDLLACLQLIISLCKKRQKLAMPAIPAAQSPESVYSYYEEGSENSGIDHFGEEDDFRRFTNDEDEDPYNDSGF